MRFKGRQPMHTSAQNLAMKGKPGDRHWEHVTRTTLDAFNRPVKKVLPWKRAKER